MVLLFNGSMLEYWKLYDPEYSLINCYPQAYDQSQN